MHDNEFDRDKAERFKSTITQDSIWSYNGVLYKVSSLMENNLSQDPLTGEWVSTVRYTNNPQTRFVFYRSFTEWLRKFRPTHS
jgi:hypothetical protein